jgi:spermidine/putrescine transport system substrate-binding protein
LFNQDRQRKGWSHVHPREGWQADGAPRLGWQADGAPRVGRPTRRGFLQRGAAAALLAAGGGALLDACAPALAGNVTVPLPRPSNPVTWPVFKDNPSIASGLPPERGATLQIFNWVAYVNQACVNNFQKKYNCKAEVTTFNTMDEALAKLRSGLTFDVFMGVTVDVLGQLIESKLIQPVNHSYLPNITQEWPDFQNPFYDQGWRYTVPYTIYTTGMAWRKDYVHENPYTMRNPWAMPWQAKYKGKVAILDDYREGISLGLMKNGIFNLNTTDLRQIALSRQSLQDLVNLVDVHIDNNDYTEVPTGQIWIHHAWSGDMAAAGEYMPKGVPVEVVGYWFPPDGKGPVANDTLTILRSATNPVLAHLFLNYLMDLPNALENISYNGYMQPLNEITPQRLVKEKILPPSLASTAVLPSYFRRGIGELQLPVDADALWQQAWLVASNGI